MKSFFKFALLATLIIIGKLAKQPAPIATAQTVETKSTSGSSVVMVHQVLTSEPVKPAREQQQELSQQSGSGMLAEMF